MTEFKPANENDTSAEAIRVATNDNDPALADDLLRGAEEIAIWMYGSADFARRVYHLTATSTLPHFKLGSMICCRKSVLLAWIADQENRRRS